MASLGSTPGLIVAAGVGAAASAALNPAFEVPKQEAWARNANRLIATGTVAELIARGGVILGARDGSESGTAYAEALRQGHAANRLDRLVWLAQRMPDYGTLKALANRGLLDVGQVPEALSRHAFPADWHRPLTDLFSEILSPGELAAAIHRGLIRDPDNLLLGEQPQPPFKVDAYPVYPIPALQEARGHGFDRDRLGVLVGLQGLPMGTHEAAQAYFRGIIEHGDYIRAFNESNSRNEWAEAVLDYTRQIPTSRDFFENALRGYHDFAWAVEQAKRHGMSEADATVIYQNQGRPMTPRLITQALARGGTFKPEQGEIKDPYLAAIVEGNLKPAYYDLAYANRYALPSVFAMRGLAQSGVWNEAKTALRLKQVGWIPEDADEVAKAWTTTATGTATDPWVAKARNQLWTATHRSYIIQEIDRAEAETALARFVTDAGVRSAVLDTWDAERAVTIKSLTPSQVKSAYTQAVIPLDTALAELTRLGYDQESAARLLGTVQPVVSIPAIMAGVEADVRAGAVDAVEAIARLTAVGVKSADAAALVQTWEGG